MKRIALTGLVALVTTLALSQKKTIQERLGYPASAKLLIIHADDLGLSHSENTASIRAMEQGSVSSASIMVPCPWLPEMAAYARVRPRADLGLHITLTCEWNFYKWKPVTAGATVPGLVNAQGYFFSSNDSILARATATEVETEIRNQVKLALASGIDPTHLDTHMFTVIDRLDYLKAYIKVGHEFRIPVFLSRQWERDLHVSFDTLLTNEDVVADTLLSASPETNAPAARVEFYSRCFKNLKPGLSYLIIHTAYDDSEMRAITDGFVDWGAAWRQQDYDFFTSAFCAKLLRENDIHVISWREIREKLTRR